MIMVWVTVTGQGSVSVMVTGGAWSLIMVSVVVTVIVSGGLSTVLMDVTVTVGGS